MHTNQQSSGLIQEVSQEFDSVGDSNAQLLNVGNSSDHLLSKFGAPSPQSPGRYQTKKNQYSAYEGRHLTIKQPRNPYNIRHRFQKPDHATLLLRANAVKSKPMNVEELILSGSYKRRWYTKAFEEQVEQAADNQVNNHHGATPRQLDEGENNRLNAINLAENSSIEQMTASRE